MFNKSSDLEFKLRDEESKWIIEEHQNQMKVLQVGMWAKPDEPIDPFRCKYETRTVYIGKDGNEIMGKGCSFSEEGINELTRVLVEQGKGNTKDLLTSMSERTDFLPTLKRVLKGNPEAEDIDLSDVDEEFFDASTILDNSKEVS